MLQKPRPGWGESGVGSEPAQFQAAGRPAGRRALSRTEIVVPHSGTLHGKRGACLPGRWGEEGAWMGSWEQPFFTYPGLRSASPEGLWTVVG